MKPCWSCGSESDCMEGCYCAKCRDPEGYANWRENNPQEYNEWLERQFEGDGNGYV